MADWVDLPDSSLDPDAPVTSELAYAWRDNPIAISEGAPGAPRVQPRALETYVGRQVLTPHATSPVPITFAGLDVVAMLRVDAYISMPGAGTLSFQISGSANGGVTWGSWVTITQVGGGGYGVSMSVNLSSGIVAGMTIPAAPVSIGISNCSYVRFRGLTSSGGAPDLPVTLSYMGMVL